jgi:glycosyltransferase involved in cell wall biosynthesis
MIEISVIITTHNPHQERLRRTLRGLELQTMPVGGWEIILVDNASTPPVTREQIDPSGCLPNLSVFREEKLGLTFGRLRGLSQAVGAIIVLVDDDNVLDPHYLSATAEIFARLPKLGVGGGRRIPEWIDFVPPAWVIEFFPLLALDDPPAAKEDFGPMIMGFRDNSPIGAGMIARKEALRPWITECTQSLSPLPGRKGKELGSGEDHEMVILADEAGWHAGYFPQLLLTHLIPGSRLTKAYLARLNHGTNKSMIDLLSRRGATSQEPAAKWTLPLRKARAFFVHKAWKGPAEFVRWKGICGIFDGRALIERSIPEAKRSV